MVLVENIVIGLIAVLHLYFLVLEMFLWDKPAGLRAFGHSKEAALASRILAANMGLYNGFLAAGLFWSIFAGSEALHIKLFFLACVLIAGIFGAITVGKKILLIQALPAIIGLAVVILSEW